MKYICVRTCQITIDGQITFVKAGEVRELEKPHACFKAVGTKDIDFVKASEAELVAAPWTFKDAQKAIMAEYGVKMKKEEGGKKSDIIDQILDARFRAIDTSVVKSN